MTRPLLAAPTTALQRSTSANIARAVLGAAALGWVLLPLGARAAVWISEVAWMGSMDSPNHEWIEIANDADAPVDLTGWSLVARDGSPSISLSGTLAPREVAVLERTSDASAPQVAAFAIYTGALSNQGEILELRDTSGALVDVVDGSDGWVIGGDNETKATLQRATKGGAWFTAPATPGVLADATMAAGGSGATPSAGGEEGANDASGGAGSQTGSTSDSSAQSSKNASFAGAGYAPIDAPLEEPLPWVARIESEPAHVVAGAPVRFVCRVWEKESGKLLETGYWALWSFGDGASARSGEATHTYLYPGTYLATLTVGRDGSRATIAARKLLEVGEAKVVVREATPLWIAVANEGDHDLEISGWQLTHGNKRFVFPQGTMLAAGATVRFASAVTGLAPNGSGEVRLLYPNGVPVVWQGEKAPSRAREGGGSRSSPASVSRSFSSQREGDGLAQGADAAGGAPKKRQEGKTATSAAPPPARSGSARGEGQTAQAPSRPPTNSTSHPNAADPPAATSSPSAFAGAVSLAHGLGAYGTLALLVAGSVALAWVFGGLLFSRQGVESSAISSDAGNGAFGAHPFASDGRQKTAPLSDEDAALMQVQKRASRYTLFP